MARQLVVCAFGLGLVIGLLNPGVSTAAPQAAVRVGGAIKEPRKLKDVAPVYPADAKQAGVSGVVIIEATIDPEGNVRDARVLRSQPMFEEAAVAAVRQWKYEPTLLDGAPVSVLMTVVVNFQFKAADPAAPEPATDPNAPVRVGGDVKEPQKTKYVDPIYPEDAKRDQITGTVIIEATIARDGTVKDTRVLRSPGLLAFEQAALVAVRQWEYTPTELNGVAVEVKMTVVVNFVLK
jgi:TonB family protein